MVWVYGLLALIVYLAVGALVSWPLFELFNLDDESGLGLVFLWFWPVWVALVIVLVSLVVVAIWWVLALVTSLESPSTRLLLLREAIRERRDRLLAKKERVAAEQERVARERASAEEQQRQEAARAASRGPRNGVAARVPRDADDFESVCAEWLQRCGVNAARTAKGPDGGLDIVGPQHAAQCKFHPSNKVGAPEIQQLAGAAAQARKTEMAFFHYGPGYTDAAVTAAKQLGITLWVFDADRVQFRRV